VLIRQLLLESQPRSVEWWSKYTKQRAWETEEKAREWIFDTLQHWDRTAFGEKQGEVLNRQEADSIPIYRLKVGKKGRWSKRPEPFKIGKPVRDVKRFSWDDYEVIRPSLEPLREAGWLNPFDGYKTLGIKELKVSGLHMTEQHSFTASGLQKVYGIAESIRENQKFKAIIVDQDGTILDGHHRFRAVRDVLKRKTIPCLVVFIGVAGEGLTESRTKFTRGSFIFPDGRVVHLPRTAEHNSWLDRNIPSKEHGRMMRVVISRSSGAAGDLLYGNTCDEEPATQRQLKALRDLGIELGVRKALDCTRYHGAGRGPAPRVVFDSTIVESAERILTSALSHARYPHG